MKLLANWILAFFCLGCTARGKTPRPVVQESAHDGIWTLVPRDTDWMVLVVPGSLPAEVLSRLPDLTRDGPCRDTPAHTVLYLHGEAVGSDAFSAVVRLFTGARKGCRPPGGRTHRSATVIAQEEGVWDLWSPHASVRAPMVRAQYLADRIEHPDEAGVVEPAQLKRAVARWQPQAESPPAVALWFVRSGRISRFLKPLFPEPPLRGGLLFFVSDGWVRMRIHLEFGDTATAEAAVTSLRDGLISAMESKNYPAMDWKTALAPLVVHPEGSLLWVQWSMPVARALPLFFAVAGKE